MTKTNKTFAALVAAALSLSPFCCAYAAEASLTESTASDSYDTGAKRISYSGDFTQFSLDIPEFLSPEISSAEPTQYEDGSTDWELFFCEWDSLYISSVYHQSKGTFANEVDQWIDFATIDEQSHVNVYTNKNGTSCAVTDMHFGETDEECFEIIIGVYEIDENNWVNITFGATHNNLNEYREDINKMLTTFEYTNTTAESKDSPDTGIEAPIAAAAIAACAALTLVVSRKKH